MVEHPEVRSEPTAFFFESGLFQVIGIAIELIEEEGPADALSAEANRAWGEVLSAHSELLRTRALEIRESLHPLITRFCLQLEEE